MMDEIHLTAKLPKPSHPVSARRAAKTPEVVAVAKQFGREYFDGAREHGYGGYHYDGRWCPVVHDIVNHFDLSWRNNRVLDIGCAKGFLVHDMRGYGLDAYGLDISEYALKNCDPRVVGRLHLGNAIDLPFPDGSFDAVISINTVHNLPRDLCIQALREIERVTKHSAAFVQVGAYRTPEEKQLLEDWALTAETHGYPDEWRQIFKEAGYRGDYAWTLTTPVDACPS